MAKIIILVWLYLNIIFIFKINIRLVMGESIIIGTLIIFNINNGHYNMTSV
jgi:hypothetical protein